jgi:hypothetical protein
MAFEANDKKVTRYQENGSYNNENPVAEIKLGKVLSFG